MKKLKFRSPRPEKRTAPGKRGPSVPSNAPPTKRAPVSGEAARGASKRPPFVKRDGAPSGRAPYVKREGSGDGRPPYKRPAFAKSDSPGDKGPAFVKREGSDDRRPAYKRTDDKRPPFVKRDGASSGRAPYVKREGSGDGRPPYKRTDDKRPPFVKRDGAPAGRAPYVKREGPSGGRPPYKRPAFAKSDGPPAGREPYVKREGSDDRRPPYKRPAFAKSDSRDDRLPPFVKREGSSSDRPYPKKDKDAKKPFAKREPVAKGVGATDSKVRTPQTAPPISKGPKAQLKTLDRVLSKAGIGSRTEARSWIGAGRVRVNGLLVQTPDFWVNTETDKVLLDDNVVDTLERRYILLNKPKGYITTYKDPEGRPTVYDLLEGIDQFLGTVGRLDLDTSGLLLLTNDNDLAEAITNPAYKLEKTYLVKAATLLNDDQLDRLRKGVELNDGPTQPAAVNVNRHVGKHTFVEITITEGRNRQIRRMLEAVESKVLKLVRVKLGPLTLEDLPIGTWRDLTEAEIIRLSSGKIRPKSKILTEEDEEPASEASSSSE